MLGLIYLFIATIFGDIVCRRFLRFDSLLHRLAASFLTGILLSSCITYVFALGFSRTANPLLWANLAYFGFVSACIYLLVRFFEPVDDFLSGIGDNSRPPGNWRWDLVCLGTCFLFGCWFMFKMLNYSDSSIYFTIGTWSDFGANLSLAQSMALGNNFPTEHPFFPGEMVRYHFLFWFLSGNLSYLGLNIVWAVNIAGVLSLLALLALMMTFGEKLFNSRAVGRISLIFFFLASSSLSFIPFLASKTSIWDAIMSIVSRKNPLVSGYPYQGEDWGSLSVISFMNQRQLIVACGIILVVLIYVVDFYSRKSAFATIGESKKPDKTDDRFQYHDVAAMAFCGALIGLLPYWNTAVFIAAAAVFGSIFILFPYRRTYAALILAAIVYGLPQLLLLRSGNVVSIGQPFFTWGYTIIEPTPLKLIEYLGWTIGLKLLLLAIAFCFTPSSHRRLLIALTTPMVIVFSFQLSIIMINNHKLLNVWGLLIASFAAYSIWLIGRGGWARKALAALLTVLTVFGAVVDIFPIYNDGYIATPYGNDRLTNWILQKTKPSDVFISEMWLSHPILFAGRKVFLGNTLFAWTAGYGNLPERDRVYKEILKTNDPHELVRLLHENKIAYIAVDDGFRHNPNSRTLDEAMLLRNFELAFNDTENKYNQLKIYRVP